MLGDNKQTLTPACHEQIENEANFAAGQLLFFQDAFVRDARELSTGLDAVTALKKRYGNTMTTTLWRYVERSDVPMVGGISCHPHRPSADFNPAAPFRYFVGSTAFQRQFSSISEVGVFDQVQAYCANRKGGPLGSTDLPLADDNGVQHVFHFETFFNHYDALTLGIYRHARALIVSAHG
jgi:hypothetical protein